MAAAFGRLCVETISGLVNMYAKFEQPPSGGCVLKLYIHRQNLLIDLAAAFGRLCVETVAAA